MSITESTGLRERKKLSTRRALHEAAVALVERHGLDGTTVEAICEAADVSTRTFFNYFPSKSAAVLALPEDVLSDAAVARFRASGAGVVDALAELLAEGFAVGDVERRRMKALIVEHPELRMPFQQWMGAVRERILDLAEERLGDRDDALIATSLVMAAVGVIVHDPAGSDDPIPERVREIVDRFVVIAGR